MVRAHFTGSEIIFLISRGNVRENSGRKWEDLQQDEDGRETVEN